ncbi:unnamed protein product [Rotaria sp. Silwood1]|nr:unnamed protein product [Rotaria sp. Silwood1]
MCAGFNATEELVLTIQFLKRDHNALQSQSVRQRAMAFIRRLETLCNELESKQTVNHLTYNEQPRVYPSTSNDDEVDSCSAETYTAKDDVPVTTSERNDENQTLTTATNSFLTETILPASAVPTPVPSTLPSNEPKEQEIMPFNRDLLCSTSGEEKRDSLSSAVATSSPLPTETEKEQSCTTITNNNEHFNTTSNKVWSEYTVDKLLEIHDRTRDKPDRKAIKKELSRRCRGKSTGYLSYNDLMI